MVGDKFHSLDESEEKLIAQLKDWLYSKGAKYDSLRVVNFQEGYRGVVATRPIQKKQRIVFIPKEQLITLEIAKQENICKEIINRKVELISPKHTFLAIFILQEISRKQDAIWKHYINILPKDHRCFPINYTSEELSELIGSPFLMHIHEKVFDLKTDYQRIYTNSEQFRKYKFRDFCWARTIVASRMFGVFINGKKTNILAPFADMLNHKLPKETMWNYVQNDQGFAIESLCDIPEGVQIFDSYGRKCNSRYLLSYGFVIDNNPDNQICLKATIDGPFRDKKLEMIKKTDGTKIIKISKNLSDNNFYQAMGFLRFIAINQFNQLAVLEKISGIKITNQAYLPAKTPPITVELQIIVWKSLQMLCENSLKEYPNSLEEDQRILREEKLSENRRNIIIIRKGQKVLYHYYINICKEVVQTLEKGYVKAFEDIVSNQQKPWAVYLFKILGIMPHEKRKEVAHLTIEQPINTVTDIGDQEQLDQD